MNEPLATIDDVILTVFGNAVDRNTGIKRRRIQQVEHDLRAFLEAAVDTYLTDDERTLLAAEREFAPEGAACRALDPEVLFIALIGFITPPHLAPDLLLRRMQLDLVDALIGYVAYDVLREYDTSCIRQELRSAVFRARLELKRERADQAWAREVAKSERRRKTLGGSPGYIDEQFR